MILALYSKGRFDKEARGLGVGDVFDIDRYTSKHKTFQALEEGGALFVVTVRPDDVLWLVAVLEDPRNDSGAWVSIRNSTPIVDIAALVSQITFTSGKGIKVGPGKLGMSLQTPRALSGSDIQLLRAATQGAAPKPKGAARSSAKTKSKARPKAKSSARARSKPKSKPKVKVKAKAKAKATPAPTSAPPTPRVSELQQVAEHLGKGWQLDGEQLVHTKSGARFAYVPGGWLRMGFSLDDIYAACQARRRRIDMDSSWPGEAATSRPAHMVAVAPFVVAIEKHPRDDKTLGQFRHPSEAELEWVYRRGGFDRWVGVPHTSDFQAKTRWKLIRDPVLPFGIDVGYDQHEICADDWHNSYVGAPATSEPWGTGCSVFRCLHTMWQDDDEEVLSVHVAHRDGQSSPQELFRPTLPLPKLAMGQPQGHPPPALESEQLLAALNSKDKAANRAAWWALTVAAGAPAADAAVLVDWVLGHLPDEVKALRQALGCLGELLWGSPPGHRQQLSEARLGLHERLPTPGKSKAWQQLARLVSHQDKAVRLAAILVVTAACRHAGKGAAVLEQRLADEPDKVVAATLVIALALLGRQAPTVGDAKLERALTKVRALADGLRGDADPMAIADALDVTGMNKVPWFAGALGNTGRELLLAAPAAERERVALALCEKGTVMLDLLFPWDASESPWPGKPLRRLNELSPAQQTLVEAQAAQQSWHGYLSGYRLPASQLGHEVMFGRSDLLWAKVIDAPTGKAPIYYAVMDLWARHRARGDEVEHDVYEQEVRTLLGKLSLVEIYQLRAECEGSHELTYGYYAAWPWRSGADMANFAQAASKAKRAALAAKLRQQLREHLEPLSDEAAERWPDAVSVATLAACLNPGERFPETALAALSPSDTFDFHGVEGMPVDFPEPAWGDWLQRNTEVHVHRAMRGEEALDSKEVLHLEPILSPRWALSSVLMFLAYESREDGYYPALYDTLKNSPALAAHWQAIPSIVHEYDGDSAQPEQTDPRAAVTALWNAAMQLRKQGK